MSRFDLAVIGAGSGGLAGALRAARHGARVVLFEPGLLGGTCVNQGCVPKKAMWLAAEMASQLAHARALGFALPDAVPLDWPQLLARRQGYIDNIHASYRRQLDAAGIEQVAQRAQLTGQPGEVCSGGSLWQARHILLATGGRPHKPEIPGAELAGVSDDFFALQAAPRKVAVVGGGYVGVELAGVLRALGSEVALLARDERVLPRFDAEMTAALARHMQAEGISLHFSSQLECIRRNAAGTLDLATSQGALTGFDQVLFAAGRRPNTENLGLEAAGVRLDARGLIEIDAFQNTSVPGIYAVGDVTPQPALTPFAVAASRRLMDRLFAGDKEARMTAEWVPSVVFSHPPLATVGLSEEDARKRYGDAAIHVRRAEFRPMRNALLGKEARSLFKLVLLGSEARMVGLHLLGDASDEMLQGFAVAIRRGVCLSDLHDTLAIHPTSAEEVVLM